MITFIISVLFIFYAKFLYEEMKCKAEFKRKQQYYQKYKRKLKQHS